MAERESVGLYHGTVCDLGTARVGMAFLTNPAYDGQPVSAELTVAPFGGAEYDVTVREGDRFLVGDVEWLMRTAENVGTYGYVVWIDRLGVSTAVEPPAVAGLQRRLLVVLAGAPEQAGDLRRRLGLRDPDPRDTSNGAGELLGVGEFVDESGPVTVGLWRTAGTPERLSVSLEASPEVELDEQAVDGWRARITTAVGAAGLPPARSGSTRRPIDMTA